VEVGVHLAVVRTVDDTSGECWELYQRAFEDLRVLAVQRHLMNHAEFHAIMVDERVEKFLVTDDDGHLTALATMTNDLPVLPLISPDYFAHRWPELYAARRVWYVSFVAVDPAHHNAGVMNRIIERMCREAEDGTPNDTGVGGVICVDICEHREDAQRLPVAIERQAGRHTPGVKRLRLDAQVYWAYEFPTPA
jgi:hypothetical protein